MKKYKNINWLKWRFLFFSCMILLGSCNKNKKQDIISVITTTSINGGAIVRYQLLNTDSIAYVLARYAINDKVMREVQSPVNHNSITLAGFSSSKDYEVNLYSVTKAGELSAPISILVHPKTPPFLMVRSTLKIEPDFGGFNINAVNDMKSPIGITLFRYDGADKSESIMDRRFFSDKNADYTIRDGDTNIQQIGIYVSDLYGNNSDTLFRKMTAMPERLLNKSKFKIYPLPSDTENGYNWFLPYLWDGHTDGSSNGWHTNPAKQLPILCTFNLDTVAALSHFVMWERPDEYCYKAGNPKNFSVWGTLSKAPKDANIPTSSPVGTVSGDWINLGNYHYPDPPSGSKPGATVAADNAFVKAGVSFNIKLKSHPIRMVRIAVSDTWSGVNYAHIMELSLYGEGAAFADKTQ